MKIVIERDGVKRKIEGAFRVCMSREDAVSLRLSVEEFLSGDSVFGWFVVTDFETGEPVIDEDPRPWVEE